MLPRAVIRPRYGRLCVHVRDIVFWRYNKNSRPGIGNLNYRKKRKITKPELHERTLQGWLGLILPASSGWQQVSCVVR
jgi:hypothetical protein